MKNPQIRLMDLLHGWGEFLSIENNGEPRTADAVFDLYQKVGQVEHWNHADFTDAMEAIGEIVRRGG